MADTFDAMPGGRETGRAETDGATEALRQTHAELLTVNTALNASPYEFQEQNAHLRANQAQLAAIIGTATDAIVTIDEHRRVVLFNRELERPVGAGSRADHPRPL
jgi:PAS domain-containing protein